MPSGLFTAAVAVAATAVLAYLIRRMEHRTMANFDALNERIAGLGDAIAAAQDRIAADFQALKDLLASDADDQAAVDAAVAKLDESIAVLGSIDPDASNPPVA